MFALTQYTGFAASSASAFDPASPATLAVWWDFSDATKVTTTGTNRISAITDKSTSSFGGIGYVSGTITRMPLSVSSAQNGLAAASFVPIGTVGATPRYVPLVIAPGTGTSTATFLGTSNNRISVTGVYKITTSSYPLIDISFPGLVNMQDNQGNTNILDVEIGAGLSTNGTATFVFALANQLALGNIIEAPPFGWRVFSLAFGAKVGGTNGSATYRLDGGVTTATGSITNTYTDTVNFLQVGADLSSSGSFPGMIGEVRVFSGQLTLSAIQQEEGYLAWKWGLQGNLPSGHPYKNAPP